MILLKSFLVGLLAVVLALILTVVSVIAVNMSLSQGSSGIGAVSIGLVQVGFVGALIFAAGFWCEYRRAASNR